MDAESPGQSSAYSETPVVLIADDEFALRLLVHVTLRSKRYRILEAVDGQEALALAQQCRPVLVLLDVNMPGLDGVEVARKIRTDPSLAATKIVFLTGRLDPGLEEAAGDAGADHFLTKPFSPVQLLDLVDQIVGAADD
ncbi:MAG: response regulator [Chloroflexi bacterium]|nr:response regulator [Chloroflexota bacterium]